jgi:hypothetical protein
MDALLEKLETRLREWQPETAKQARARVAGIIDAADSDTLDLARSLVPNVPLTTPVEPRATRRWSVRSK